MAAGRCPEAGIPFDRGGRPLDDAGAKTDNCRNVNGRSITLETQHVEEARESRERLRLEAAELHASRGRIAAAALADRRSIERELHDRLQQRLVALAVAVELARRAVDADPSAAAARLDELHRDVREALAEAASLAQRIYPPLLEAAGLAAALRAAAASAGVRLSVDVHTRCAPELAAAVYWCCLDALGDVARGSSAAVAVRDEDVAVAFEIETNGLMSAASTTRLQDRVGAFDGRVTVDVAGGRTRVAGSVPLP